MRHGKASVELVEQRESFIFLPLLSKLCKTDALGTHASVDGDQPVPEILDVPGLDDELLTLAEVTTTFGFEHERVLVVRHLQCRRFSRLRYEQAEHSGFGLGRL